MQFKTGKELADEARTRVAELSAAQVRAIHERGENVVYLDVREPNEWNLGRIAGAVHLPRGNLESRIEAIVPRDRRVIVYCTNGNRSALAADTMRQMGYLDVASISDGWVGWVSVDGEVEG